MERGLRQTLVWGVGAWLLLWELHVVFSIDAGWVFSRFAHDGRETADFPTFTLRRMIAAWLNASAIRLRCA